MMEEDQKKKGVDVIESDMRWAGISEEDARDRVM